MEVTPEWLTALETLEGDYRVEVAEPRGDNFGIAPLSRDIEVATKLIRTGDGLAFIEARTPGLTLLGVHPLPPLGAEYTASRNAALDLIAGWRAEQAGPVVVMGDLNTTPFSASFSRLTDADLVSSQRGFGVQATWPQVPWFLAPARIPIDHLLHSPDVVTVRREVGDGLGSDHLPLLVTLRLR